MKKVSFNHIKQAQNVINCVSSLDVAAQKQDLPKVKTEKRTVEAVGDSVRLVNLMLLDIQV